VVPVRVGRGQLQQDHVGLKRAGGDETLEVTVVVGKDVDLARARQATQRAVRGVGGHSQFAARHALPVVREPVPAYHGEIGDLPRCVDELRDEFVRLGSGLTYQHGVMRLQVIGQ